MADVFLSYARDDLATAGELARHLEWHGWSVWFDADMPAGASWRMQIHTELTAANVVVVLWSKRSITRHWVHEEAMVALESGKLLQGLLEADVQIPFGYTTLQATQLWDWQGEDEHDGLSRLRDAISAKVAPTLSSPETAPVQERRAPEPSPPTPQPEPTPVPRSVTEPDGIEPPAPAPAPDPAPAQASASAENPFVRQLKQNEALSSRTRRSDRFVNLSGLHWTGYPVMALFLLAVGLVGASIPARYLFNTPLMGFDFELAPWLVGLCAVFGAVLAASRGELVTAPISSRIMRGTVLRRVKSWLNALCGAATSGAAAYALYVVAAQQARFGEVTQLLGLPIAPFTYAMGAGAGMIALALLWRQRRPGDGAHP